MVMNSEGWNVGYADKWRLGNTYTTLVEKTEGKEPQARSGNGRITLESFLKNYNVTVTQHLHVKLHTEMNLWAPQRVVKVLYSQFIQPSKVRGL
jgi:hypothetical protein